MSSPGRVKVSGGQNVTGSRTRLGRNSHRNIARDIALKLIKTDPSALVREV